jgi:Ca2+-dependent lipid-binding protein
MLAPQSLVLYFKEDNLAQVSFTSSLKKKLYFAVFATIFTVIGSFILAIKLSASRTDILIFLLAVMAVYLLVSWRFAKNANCPHCNQELFNAIANAKMYKIQFDYCPTCGGEIEI